MNRYIQWTLNLVRETRNKRKKSSLTSALRYFYYRIYNDALMGELLDVNTLKGENIFETDWDVLIILDACRYDMLKEIEDNSDFPFVDDVEKRVSVGHSTPIWLKRTFTEKYMEEISRTLYVTGNLQTELIFRDHENTINPEDFLKLDEVWRYAWDDETGTVRPESVTDRAIRNYREIKPDRTVVHYMQPHFPSLEHPELASEIQLDRQLVVG